MTIFELYTEAIWLEEHVMYVIKYIIHYMSIVFPSGMQLSLNYANLGVQLFGLNSPEEVRVRAHDLVHGNGVCVCVSARSPICDLSSPLFNYYFLVNR